MSEAPHDETGGAGTPPARPSDAPTPSRDAAPAAPAADPPRGSRLTMTPSQRAFTQARAQRLTMLVLRVGYLAILVLFALLPYVAFTTEDTVDFRDWLFAFLATFAFGTIVLVIDAITPEKRLASVFAVYFGVAAGMVIALALASVIDVIAESWDLTERPWTGYTLMAKLAIGITICYLAISIVLTTKDDLRLVIPYVEFKREVRGLRPMLLDTSVLIDGRVDALGRTGFLDAPVIVPEFVVDELQRLADSADRLKRARGRRGLDMVRTLLSGSLVDATIDPADPPGHSVDHKLLQLAKKENLRILTTDYNLNKVAQIHDVTVLNVNDLSNQLRPQAVAGDPLEVEIAKPGENEGQGVGYLPDGTMVVVEQAADRIGETLGVVVTNSLQTSAGRLIFARADGNGETRESPAERMAREATGQERAAANGGGRRPDRRAGGDGRRNPRRG